jgi:hypothetical protein
MDSFPLRLTESFRVSKVCWPRKPILECLSINKKQCLILTTENEKPISTGRYGLFRAQVIEVNHGMLSSRYQSFTGLVGLSQRIVLLFSTCSARFVGVKVLLMPLIFKGQFTNPFHLMFRLI